MFNFQYGFHLLCCVPSFYLGIEVDPAIENRNNLYCLNDFIQFLLCLNLNETPNLQEPSVRPSNFCRQMYFSNLLSRAGYLSSLNPDFIRTRTRAVWSRNSPTCWWQMFRQSEDFKDIPAPVSSPLFNTHIHAHTHTHTHASWSAVKQHFSDETWLLLVPLLFVSLWHKLHLHGTAGLYLARVRLILWIQNWAPV